MLCKIEAYLLILILIVPTTHYKRRNNGKKIHSGKNPLHFFRRCFAEKYGVDEAIMLNHLMYWIAINSKNNTNQYDGRCWTFNSAEKFKAYVSYWSTSQIRRILQSLVKQDVIIEGNYNKHKYDRTKWYALKEEQYFLENFSSVDEIENWN